MKESEFQAWIVGRARAHDWRVWHVPTPMRPTGNGRFVPDARGAGLPDLILLHEDPPRLIFAEVKDHDGVLSDAQREFLRLVRDVAQDERDVLHAHAVIVEATGRTRWDGSTHVAAYLWRPGVEDLVEATLRGKVLPA